MSENNISHILSETVDALSTAESLRGLFHQHADGMPLPSGRVLGEIIELARCILFPGYYGQSSVNPKTIRYHIGVNLERMHSLLSEQILAGLCFAENADDTVDNRDTLFVKDHRRAEQIATELVARMPQIRRTLSTDVVAAYNGDPAAESHGEIISCYPVIKALINYRIAHELHLLGVPLIPRMLTEMAHSETGIDIHPAATIGRYFTIDHGTGVVIGATCIIGESIFAASLAAALQAADGRNARLIVPTAHAPQLLPPGTITCPSETALIAMLADAAALLADPLYQALCPPDLPFLPLPHTACSGRLYEAQQRNLLDDAAFSALLKELRYKAPLQNYGKESP